MALDQPHVSLGKVTIIFATKLKSFNVLPVMKKSPTESRVIKPLEKEIKEEKSTDKSGLTPFPDPALIKAENFSSPKFSSVALDIDDKPQDICHLGYHNTNKGTDVSSALISSATFQREQGEVLSPASSVDLLNTLGSSKESIFSEDLEKERSWSTLPIFSPSYSPVSLSQTVSSCSFRSGAFTPSVVKVKCHTLSSGSSLVQMLSTSSKTLGYNIQTPSTRPFSTHGRHKLPPTPLSLLTAILRKGRLPVLSPALHRPYSPCWPISQVSISSCSACSSAQTVAPVLGLHSKPCVSEESCQNARPSTLTINRLLMSAQNNSETICLSPTLEKKGISDSYVYTVKSRIAPSLSYLTFANAVHSETFQEDQTMKIYEDNHLETVPNLFFSSSSVPHCLSLKQSNSCHSSKKKAHLLSACKGSTYSEDFRKGSVFTDKQLGQQLTQTTPTLDSANACEPSPDFNCMQAKCNQSLTDPKSGYQSQVLLASPMVNDATSRFSLQNDGKIHAGQEESFPTIVLSNTPSPTQHQTYTSPISSVCNSPIPDSSATKECYTLSPFLLTPNYYLSPSPSYSLCSSPSPSQRDSGTPESVSRSNKIRKAYKNKFPYKVLAAIPTNTLLLEQKATDDTKKNNISLDSDSTGLADPHEQICTPSELRQRSTELYEVIDEVLEDVNQMCQPSPVNNLTVKSVASGGIQRKQMTSPSPKYLGKETKYATCSQSPASPDRTMTGVVRRSVIMARTSDKVEEHFSSAFN